jgi:hypothetical protein
MVTLVGMPDGERILVEDALFDAEPTLGGRRLSWTETLALACRGALDGVEYGAAAGVGRSHLYSAASLAQAAADGWLAPDEHARLATAIAAFDPRLDGVPRAALDQAHSTSLAAWARVPANAAALAETARRTGEPSPLGLLRFPMGGLPLTGDPRMDAAILRVVGPPAGARAAEAAAAPA